MFIKITGGFAPDSPDITNPGVVLDCLNMYSTPRGMKTLSSDQQQSYPVQSAAWTGAAEVTMISGATRLFAASATQILELNKATSTYTDRTRASGVYSTTGQRWDSAQQGDLTIFTNKIDVPQVSTGGIFSDGAATFPKCSYIETVGEFIHLAGTNDATYGDLKDGWWVSKDYTLWTPSIATQCYRNRVVDPPGPFTGLRRLRDDAIYYKRNAMLVSRDQGPPDGWIFDLISNTVGAVSNDSIVAVGDTHYFLGSDNFYAYDGGLPQAIGNDLAIWIKAQLALYTYDCFGVHDPSKNIIIWYFSNIGVSGDGLQFSLIYSLDTGKWGYATPIYPRAVCQHTNASTNVVSPIIFGSALKSTSATAAYAYLMTGTPASSWLKTGYLGDDANLTNLRSVRPRAAGAISSASTLTPELYRSLGVQDAAVSAITIANRKYDVLKSANWFRNKFSFTNETVEFLGYTPDLIQAGK